jgi:hypothetical protein
MAAGEDSIEFGANCRRGRLPPGAVVLRGRILLLHPNLPRSLALRERKAPDT